MARVVIFLEDRPNGKVTIRVEFGKSDGDSQAEAMALEAAKYLREKQKNTPERVPRDE